MKGSVCLLEFKKIDTKCTLHGLWFTLRSKRFNSAEPKKEEDNPSYFYVYTFGAINNTLVVTVKEEKNFKFV